MAATEPDPQGLQVVAKLWLDCTHPTINAGRSHLGRVRWLANGFRGIDCGGTNGVSLNPSFPHQSPNHWDSDIPVRERTVLAPEPTAAPGSGISRTSYLVRCRSCRVVWMRRDAEFWEILEAARRAGLPSLDVSALV